MHRRLSSLALFLTCAFPVAQAADWHVVVSGLGGTEPYIEQFPEQAGELAEALEKLTGSDRVALLSGEDATLEAVETVMAEFGGRMSPADRFSLHLIGHGAWDGRDYKFNIAGPDLTAARLAELLDALPTKRQLVVVATSSSGAALDALTSDERTLITATKSANERTAVQFGRYWIEALSSNAADTDKDERIDAAEAYAYAERAVADHFERNQLLASEHSRLEGPESSLPLASLTERATPDRTDPMLAGLLDERNALESRIAALRGRRDELDDDTYFGELEPLLIELATLQSRIDTTGVDEATGVATGGEGAEDE